MLYVKFITGCFAAALLLGGCTKETEQKGTDPVTPDTDNTRREVMMTLKNKLSVMPLASKAEAPIATAAENTISTLDVYVFGADKEDGDYSFRERFAYRATPTDKLPDGASELQLNASADDDKETTALIKLKRGLFVKLYCIANDTTLIDPATDDVPVKASAFIPLTLTENEGAATITKAGSPLESSFLSWHTALLKATGKGDTLATPLTMAGAYTTPIDLTDPNSATRIQTSIKLTRLIARFDIDNKSGVSRFIIETVSMGNGRRGSGFFPIRVYGDLPEAKPDELITYPERTFYREEANNGLTTGAFYIYPSPKDDKAFLILNGKYKVNETEMKDVSYQIPFMQQGADGNATWFDIANNHRYTVNISKADAYHLDANIKVADWADDGSFEYTPENGSGDFEVTIPDSFKDDSKYDKENNTVTMSLKADSEFDLTVSTSSSLTWKKTYVGGLAAQQYDWLEIEEAPTNPISKASHINCTYTFKPKADYDKTRFPRAVIRFTNGMDGSETVLFVEPVITAPQFVEIEQESDNRNSYDAEAKTISMYRVLDSKVKVKVNCPHGIHIASQPDWLEVAAIETVLPFTTYEISLKADSRDTEVTDNKGTITFQNEQEAEQQNTVTITLLDASIAADFSILGGTENTYDEPEGKTPGNVNMKLLKDNAFTISTTSLDGVTIETDFDGGPEWFSHDGRSFSRSGNNTETFVFTLDVDALSAGKAKKTTVTLHNVSKGIDKQFTVTPFGYEIINIEQTSSTGNNLIDETINMVKMSSTPAYHAQITLEVTSPGGSRVSVSGTGLTISEETSSTAYTTSYILDAASTAGESGTLTIANYLEPSSSKELTVNVKDGTVTYTSKSTGNTYPALEMASYWVAPVTEGLANYTDAQTKCPEGWKLPSANDLRNMIRNDKEALQTIFLPGGDPKGMADYSPGYWSSSLAPSGNTSKGVCIEVDERSFNSYIKDNSSAWTVQRTSNLNVRCIKNKE